VTALAATLSPSWYWYFARATGLVALVLLTAVLVLGILSPLRISSTRWPRFAIDSLHRDVSLLAVVVILIHVLVSVLDGYARINLIDAVVPFIASYRPLWLGLGALAFDLILALVLTSVIRRRLGYRSWRLVHWLAYASWPVAVLHGLGTGSDASQRWALALTFACILVVAVATIARLVRAASITDGWRTAGYVATVGIALAFYVFALVGPLSPHWAARAGTPSALIAKASAR
jgi:predicted ferric reductase